MKRIFLAAILAGLMMVGFKKSFGADDAGAGDFAVGSNAFAVDLYKEVAAEGDAGGNILFSPYSIDTALLMVSVGAKGKTLEEFARVLHLGADMSGVKGAASVAGRVRGDGKVFSLTNVNGIWVEKGFPVLPGYVEEVEKMSGLKGVFSADFSGDAEGERKSINAFVLEHTGKKIADLIPEKVVNAGTRVVVANAIYFKAAWDEPFSKEGTKEEPFHLADGKEVTASMMHMTRSFAYGEKEGVQVLSMGYRTSEQGGSDLSMVIVLPTKVGGLAAVEKGLTSEGLDTLVKGMGYGKVNVTLPKFKVTQAISLRDVLQKMGLRAAFTQDADFSGMVAPVSGEAKVSISAVVHKAFIDVNEEGTEAAAGTAVAMRAGSARREAEPVDFRCDRTFLFLVRENRSGAILFMGRVGDPTKG